MIKSKIKASITHLILSILIVSTLLGLVLYFWYPTPFLKLSGVLSILIMLIGIDIILGPLLTFIVFKPNKKTLKLDLSVIAVIQLAALSYGIYTIYQAHPLYIVYAIDRFTPIYANEVTPREAKYPEFQRSKLAGPVVAYLQKPTDPAELSKITLELFSGKADLDARPEYYKPLDQHIDQVLAQGVELESYLKKPENQLKMDSFLKKHGKSLKDYAFLPLSGKEEDVFWVWNRTTKQPIDIIAINPWEKG